VTSIVSKLQRNLRICQKPGDRTRPFSSQSRPKLRILILSYEFPPLGGGAGNATAELVKALEGWPDWEVRVVTSSIDHFRQEAYTQNSRVYFLPISKRKDRIHYQSNMELLRYNFSCHYFLRKFLREERFDICHAVMTVPSGLNAWLYRAQIPYIVSLQGSDVPGYSDRYSVLYRFITPVIHRIWKDSLGVVSNSAALRTLALSSAPLQKVDVITNGIDNTKFMPPDPSERRERNRIVCVGRLIERKGVRELLEAFKKVAAKIENVQLDLVGGGILEKSLKQRAREMGIRDKVAFHGSVPRDKVHQHLKRSSLFVLPSHNEGMSNALLEGMACGLPIVVTDTGGTSELLRENGLLVPKNDPCKLAEAMLEILSDDNKLRSMGETSRQISKTYSWRSMAEQYIALYLKALSSSEQQNKGKQNKTSFG